MSTAARDPGWHWVRVHWPDHTILDAIRGRDRAEALAKARANWITETPAEPAQRIDYLGEHDDRLPAPTVLIWAAPARGRVPRTPATIAVTSSRCSRAVIVGFCAFIANLLVLGVWSGAVLQGW